MQVVASIEYEKLQQIGAGQGMNSEVFLARDPQLNGEIAVKEIDKAKFGNILSSYFDEAQIMFASVHQNVVPVLYACETLDKICLAMPLFKRGSLTGRIENGPLPPKECLRIAHGVLSGLARIHSLRFVHLDIKPSNVLFSDVDAPMLADFGQSRRLAQNGTVIVPRMYMPVVPPETWQYQVATLESDIYQCGLLLYRALNGEPFYDPQLQKAAPSLRSQILAGKFPDKQAFLPHVPKRLRTLIRRALKIDPADRYHSALEFSAALGRVKLDLDWAIDVRPDGSATWRAERAGKATFIVECSLNGGKWETRVWSESGGAKRAKSRSDYWASSRTRAEAYDLLKTVFAELG
jgi:eukaryotic-like serine/threonine-protein kinase